MRKATRLGMGLAVSLVTAAGAAAQPAPDEHFLVELKLDSGFVENGTPQRAVVFSTIVELGGVACLRLEFDTAVLGAAPTGGRPTKLRLTSLLDGGVQTLNSTHLEQWRYTSAYFNGDILLVEILADPGAEPSRLVVTEAYAGPPLPIVPETICGPTDDRVPSFDPRAARNQPGGCTSWMIDDANHCFLTAGHCMSGLQMVEFNVPLSSSGGALRHPGPEDQYSVEPASRQTNGGQGAGNDWGYFGCFPNTQTGLTPFEAQGDYFVLAFPPPVAGQEIRITGYGTVSAPISPTWNQVQKTHVGPYWELVGTLVRYRTDTTGGNSGSPVILEDTNEAIGIHGQTGCTSTGGSNRGTGVNLAGLQNALTNPRGVCAPSPCPTDLDGNGVVDLDDLGILLADFGCTVPGVHCPGDINNDGVVDLYDLGLLLSDFGSTCP